MRTIGGWVVTGQLGSGGGGAVLRVRDARTGGEAALKLAAGGRPLNEHEQRRFAREVEALKRLDHPGLTRLLGAGTEQGRAFLVTPLIAGESLAERLRRGPLDERETARIAREVAVALAHAHEQGVLHRDLKPENVLLTPEGNAVLIDFGLAMDLDLERSRLTQTGAFLGTPGWWPPEQALGRHERIGPASDVYGVGALLYAMLTGGPPVVADSLVEVLAAAMREVDPPSSRRPGLDRRLDRLVARCLAREPVERFGSAAALVAALDELASPKATPPPRSSRRAPAVRPSEAGAGVKLASALSAVVVLLLGGVVVARRVGPTRDDGPAPAVEPSRPASASSVREVVASVSTQVAVGPAAERVTADGSESAAAAATNEPDEATRKALARLQPAELDRRLAEDPGDLEARAARAFFHACMERVEQGEADAALVLAAPEATPGQRALAHYARGLARARRQELALALADFDVFIASGSVHPRARQERGAVRLAMNDPAGALEDVTAALVEGVTPRDEASGLLVRGLALVSLGRAHAARDDVSAALAMSVLSAAERKVGVTVLEGLQRDLPAQDPTLAEARELRRAGRADEARALLDARLAAAPDDADALVLRGRLVLEAGDPGAARSDAERAMLLRPAWGEAALVAGQALLAAGDLRGAEQPLRNATVALVRDARAWRAMARWADATGNTALAARCRTRAERLPPLSE